VDPAATTRGVQCRPRYFITEQQRAVTA